MAKIAIVGCGAMGSVYAALMASAGHDVYGVTLWEAHARAMERDGLRLEGASGERVARVHGRTSTEGIGACDLVVIATKSYDVEAAARAALPLLGPRTPVQAIQNGLGSDARIAAIVGADRLAVGVAGGFGASLRGPGHAHHNGMEMLRFGPFAGLAWPLLEEAARPWESAGFKVRLFHDIRQMVWEKLILNVAFSGTACLTGLTIGEILESELAWPVARACAEEAVAVAHAAGIPLDVGDPIAHIRRLGGKIAGARPSALLDHLARQRSEIDAINGSIPRVGAPLGVPAPVNATIVALVKLREQAFAA
jgi:2-dehydropantoate 2-reductase